MQVAGSMFLKFSTLHFALTCCSIWLFLLPSAFLDTEGHGGTEGTEKSRCRF
jgi:hypothetical protein